MAAEVYREHVDPAGSNNPHSFAIQMIGTGRRVLEIGCSVGHVTEQLVRAGNSVVGVEIDAAAAEEAREFAERVHVADLDHTSVSTLEPSEFDVALLGDVLEHLRDPLAALRDVLRLVRPGGTVIVSVPNVAHIDVRLMLLEGRWQYQGTGLMDATHLRWFTRESLRSMLHDAGLVAIRLERVRIGRYGSDIDLDTAVPRDDVLGYIEADPDAYTFQYVVEAVRSTDESAPAAADDALVLDAGDWQRPRLDHSKEIPPLVENNRALTNRIAELEVERDALQAHVDAWERSLIGRTAAPVRRVVQRLRARR